VLVEGWGEKHDGSDIAYDVDSVVMLVEVRTIWFAMV
jgi:hypothetical protein